MYKNGNKVRTLIIGNSEGNIITDDDTKNTIINYLYSQLNLSKYRYNLLNNFQKLNFLQENEHYVSPNFKGHNYFLIFMTINSKSYCILIDRKKLQYQKDQLDMGSIQIIKIIINVKINLFNGTIFDGKIIKKDEKSYFLIQDCFYLMGKKLFDMELNQKMLYLNDFVTTNLSFDKICSNFTFKINTLYKYNDLNKLINEIMPKCGIPSSGLIFYPKLSGITVLYIDKKIEKVDIESTQIEKIEATSYDLICNFTKFLESRTYSYEKEGKIKNLWLKKTDLPDVYNIYEKRYGLKTAIAHIPNLKISHYCSNNIKNDFTLCKCIYNNKFNKWIPLQVINNE
jgi:hypothetical protein